jgi:hypothetical protein
VPDAVRLRYIPAADSMAYEQKRRKDSLRHFCRELYYNYTGLRRNFSARVTPPDEKDYSAWYERFKNDLQEEARQLEKMNAYAFQTGRLGWINCDRFYNYPGGLTDFVVNLPDSLRRAAFQAFLVFKDIRSIFGDFWLGPSAISFKNLPSGMEVYLILVAAVGKQVYAAIEPTRISTKPLQMPVLKPVTPQQFRQQMALVTGSDNQTALK